MTFGIWSFLQSADAEDWITHIPLAVQKGQRASELIRGATLGECPEGLLNILRAAANQGTQGGRGVHDHITSMGSDCWHRLRPLLLWALPIIRDWKVTNLSYELLPNVEATWFVDPPYANAAGSRYRTNTVNHHELGEWCQSRNGQVIACENAGATWLPFRPLVERQGVQSRYQKSKALEVIWTSDDIIENSQQQTA